MKDFNLNILNNKGMAWAITSAAGDLDIDIFFQENAQIGQKMYFIFIFLLKNCFNLKMKTKIKEY